MQQEKKESLFPYHSWRSRHRKGKGLA